MFQEKIVIQKNEIKNWKTDSVQQVDFTTESVSDGCEKDLEERWNVIKHALRKSAENVIGEKKELSNEEWV